MGRKYSSKDFATNLDNVFQEPLKMKNGTPEMKHKQPRHCNVVSFVEHERDRMLFKTAKDISHCLLESLKKCS